METNEKLNNYSVSLTVVRKEDETPDDVLACKIETLRCDVTAENFVNACVYAQAYFSEKLGVPMEVESGFCYGPYEEKQKAEEIEYTIESEVSELE